MSVLLVVANNKENTNNMSIKIEIAKTFADKKFKEVGTENHFLEVLQILKDDLGVSDESVLIAGILHDVIEDTNTNNQEIREVFSLEVLSLVLEVSHPKNWQDYSHPNKTKNDLMYEYYEKIKHISEEAKQIKIADFISHMRNFISIYSKNEQYLYPKFMNNDKYIINIRDFLSFCKESRGKEILLNLTKELETHL